MTLTQADYDLETLGRWMREALADIHAYVLTEQFRAVLAEMNTLPTLQQKDEYVRRVLLDPSELAQRGIAPPEGIEVQRSVFADHRPTAFCVVKHLPDVHRKVTITFDQGATTWPE